VSKITYVTINPDKRKGGVGKNGIIDSPTLPRVNDRRRGALEAPCFYAWAHSRLSQGEDLIVDYPGRYDVPIDQNRDAQFKTGDLLLLHVRSNAILSRPSGWEDVPNGQFSEAGMNHRFWWRRVNSEDAGVFIIPNTSFYSAFVMYGIRGAVATGNPFYQTKTKATTSTLEVNAEKRGDLFFAFGFPSTFGSFSSPPTVNFTPTDEDAGLTNRSTVIVSGDSDGNPATQEVQGQGFIFAYNPAKKTYPTLGVNGSGKLFTGFVRWEKKKQVIDATDSIVGYLTNTSPPDSFQSFDPLKGDLLIGVWFNDGDLNSSLGFWPSYFKELPVSIPSLLGVSVHVGYRRLTKKDVDPNTAIIEGVVSNPKFKNAIYLRNASEKLELIGTGGGFGLIELNGSQVNPNEMVVLFAVFSDPPYFIPGKFKSAQLKDLAVTAFVQSNQDPSTNEFGETGAFILASIGYGKGTSFTSSFEQVRFGDLPVDEPARTFAIKVRRK